MLDQTVWRFSLAYLHLWPPTHPITALAVNPWVHSTIQFHADCSILSIRLDHSQTICTDYNSVLFDCRDRRVGVGIFAYDHRRQKMSGPVCSAALLFCVPLGPGCPARIGFCCNRFATASVL